ncbi:hypothetical protein ACFSBZ_04355 [Amnibacterium flavum]|uniref:Uncharacterized protein n=1 Tax=Amnibacterium flavum TaxID=2173173 RepID=A0A2V1HNS2_9MICO|nr:hypothetical protein [Amnibacterium flavum]PVZ94283.1 hypothetical protein DDQ50_11115 [Amnibacterium flavum]
MDRYVVPDVVGMRFETARSFASQLSIALANPDPDGPPISLLAWSVHQARPLDVVIERQDPEPGHRFTSPWCSLRVWLAPRTGPETRESVPAPPGSVPPSLVAHASPDPEAAPR